MKSGYEKILISPFEDYRGQLKKIVQKRQLEEGQEIEEIYVLYSNTGTIRGNHYHKKTAEYFTVISGEAKMALLDIDSGASETITIKASDNLVIKVNCNTAHGIKNESHELLVVLAVSSKQYDPQDNDTYPYKLIE